MTTDQGDTLTIDAVVRTFQAANAQLQVAAEKIDVIAQHEVVTARASSSLEASAASVGRLVSQADEAVKSLQAALEMAARSLRAGAALLDSAVLTELQREVGALGSRIQGVENRIAAAEGTSLAHLESLSLELRGVEKTLEEEFTGIEEDLTDFEENLGRLREGAQTHASALSGLAATTAQIVQSNGRLMMVGAGILVLQVVGLVLLLAR